MLTGSTGRVPLTGCRGLLDRVQHSMARDRVVERGAEMRSLAVVAGETRVRLGDVGGRTVQRREPVLLRHGQDLARSSLEVLPVPQQYRFSTLVGGPCSGENRYCCGTGRTSSEDRARLPPRTVISK